jgi:hypothetical protein
VDTPGNTDQTTNMDMNQARRAPAIRYNILRLPER